MIEDIHFMPWCKAFDLSIVPLKKMTVPGRLPKLYFHWHQHKSNAGWLSPTARILHPPHSPVHRWLPQKNPPALYHRARHWGGPGSHGKLSRRPYCRPWTGGHPVGKYTTTPGIAPIHTCLC